jgi:hypothetical protein
MRAVGSMDDRQVGLSRDVGLDWLYYMYEPFDSAEFEPLPAGRLALDWSGALAEQWLRWRQMCVDAFLEPPDVQSRLALPAGWDSPDFASIDDLPLLRERCRQRAASFRRWKSSGYPGAGRHASMSHEVLGSLQRIRDDLPPDTGVHLSVVSLGPPRLLLSAYREDQGYTRVATIITAGLLRDTKSLVHAVHAIT